MDQQEFLNYLNVATENEIADAMNSGLCVASSFAAFEAVKRRLTDERIINGLKKMTKDSRYFCGPYSVSDLAYAALHILGINNYDGDSPNVQFWIKAKMDIGLN